MRTIKVISLHYYPIKSCRGINVDSLEVGARGPLYDRMAMVADAGGNCVTQRTHPQMAKIEVAVRGGALEIGAPGMPLLRAPLDGAAGSETLPVHVWEEGVTASPLSPEADQWFSGYLGLPCRLVRVADGHKRDRKVAAYAKNFEVAFPDRAPFLLTNLASLADLHARSPEKVPMDRFRPNIVIEGAPAFTEDGWEEVRIGEIAFPFVFQCDRCSVTLVDQRTSTLGKEPLRTLAKFRKVGSGVLFGRRLVHGNPGRIHLGDTLTILREYSR